MSARTRRRLRRAWAIGLLTGALGALFALTPPGVSLEERFGLSWLFWVRGPIEAPPKVTVVSLDRRSADSLGLGDKIHNWPRSVHARLIERLVETGASEIVFDLAFDQPREAREDAALAKAIADAGRVVLFEMLAYDRQPITDAAGVMRGVLAKGAAAATVAGFRRGGGGSGAVSLAEGAKSRELSSGSSGRACRAGRRCRWSRCSSMPSRLIRNGSIRWSASGLRVSHRPMGRWLRDALALKDFMLRVRHGFQEHTDIAERLSAKLATLEPSAADRRLLTALVGMYQGSDSRYLRFYGPPGSVRSIPLHEVLSGGRPAAMRERLAGEVVFVGQSEVMNANDDGFAAVYSASTGRIKRRRDCRDGVGQSARRSRGRAGRSGADPGLDRRLRAVIVGDRRAAAGAAGGPAHLMLAGLFGAASEIAFARADLWLPVTPLLVQLPLGLFGGLLLQYREAQRARANISRGLRYYLRRGSQPGSPTPGSTRARSRSSCSRPAW